MENFPFDSLSLSQNRRNFKMFFCKMWSLGLILRLPWLLMYCLKSIKGGSNLQVSQEKPIILNFHPWTHCVSLFLFLFFISILATDFWSSFFAENIYFVLFDFVISLDSTIVWNYILLFSKMEAYRKPKLTNDQHETFKCQQNGFYRNHHIQIVMVANLLHLFHCQILVRPNDVLLNSKNQIFNLYAIVFYIS